MGLNFKFIFFIFLTCILFCLSFCSLKKVAYKTESINLCDLKIQDIPNPKDNFFKQTGNHYQFSGYLYYLIHTLYGIQIKCMDENLDKGPISLSFTANHCNSRSELISKLEQALFETYHIKILKEWYWVENLNFIIQDTNKLYKNALVNLNNPIEFKPEFRRSSEWMNQLCEGRQPIWNDDILGVLIAAQRQYDPWESLYFDTTMINGHRIKKNRYEKIIQYKPHNNEVLKYETSITYDSLFASRNTLYCTGIPLGIVGDFKQLKTFMSHELGIWVESTYEKRLKCEIRYVD